MGLSAAGQNIENQNKNVNSPYFCFEFSPWIPHDPNSTLVNNSHQGGCVKLGVNIACGMV
jgi:hypothetical protein